MKINYKLKIGLFILLSLVLLFMDYIDHEKMIADSFKNYVWLGYFRYHAKDLFIFSVDVIVSVILFMAVLIYSFRSRKFNNWIYILFTVISIALHFMSIDNFSII